MEFSEVDYKKKQSAELPEQVFETERQKFVETYQAEQRRLLAQFIERHRPEDLPALDFTEEEANVFVPSSLLLLPEIDPQKIKVEFPRPGFVDSGSVSVFIRFGEEKLDILSFDLFREKEVFENGELPIAFIHGYSDSDLIRGKYITEDFFKKIGGVLKEIGFRVMSEENSRRNIDYFVEKLGMFPFFALAGRDDLDPNDGLGQEIYCKTYKFFDPEGESLNIRPEYLSNDHWRERISQKIWPPFNLETGRGVVGIT